MKTALFDYHLPPELIAKRPPSVRDAGRLLVLERNAISHRMIADWCELVTPGSLVVLNETRVIRARLIGQSAGGGHLEVLLLSRIRFEAGGREVWQALGRPGKRLGLGATVVMGDLQISVLERREGGLCTVAIDCPGRLEEELERSGHIPIPPYLGRPDDEVDRERYQTIFARCPGSVAAPTASLHLTPALLERLTERGVRIGRLVLHIGLDTFRPVTTDELDDHPMHSEQFNIDERLAEQIAATRAENGRVVAVGTTVVRALESACDPARPGYVLAGAGRTRLFIRPGYDFQVVDALLTNFHMPKTTLLALVSAFTTRQRLLEAYADAIERNYRFLSYGDAMWIPERMT